LALFIIFCLKMTYHDRQTAAVWHGGAPIVYGIIAGVDELKWRFYSQNEWWTRHSSGDPTMENGFAAAKPNTTL
jgi:hypothetical protein